ncbi:MAG: MBL fold metallo-hydrolase [Chloroflexi bacterium]|nr:MBL fold metallo-hydrolase [Chloroflexota bacterium]
MKFIAHYSSSAGNLYEIVAANGQRLLIDCGLTWAKMQKKLNYNLIGIEGLLLDHSHLDHSRCIEDVMEAGIDVYSSLPTFEALDVAGNRKARIVGDKDRFAVGDTFEIFSFALQHDVPNLGFIVHDKSSDENLLFVTDTSHVKQRFGLAFDIIALCCSYDVAVLREREAAGTIDPSLAKRLLTSHMSVETTKAYLRDCCCLYKCTEIWLLHMSGDNIDKERVRLGVESEFFTRTIIAGKENQNGRS